MDMQDLFDVDLNRSLIQSGLPRFFRTADSMYRRSSKKTNQGVGITRGIILIAMLKRIFGDANVVTPTSSTESEKTVLVFDQPVSIKTIGNSKLKGIKAKWTVDRPSAESFVSSFTPSCDLLLVEVVWNGHGCLYWIPIAAQQQVFEQMGREACFKLPPIGNNPRGVEFLPEALHRFIDHPSSRSLEISWGPRENESSPYSYWQRLWDEV